MNPAEVKFPRLLEAEGHADALRLLLASRMVKLWSEGSLDIPLVTLDISLEEALRRARMRRQIRAGLDAIAEKLEQESRGIRQVRSQQASPYGDRISRLLFFSRDGAQRFYRQGEALLLAHAPRLFGCLLDTDGATLGRIMTGKDATVKAVMVEHKDAVSEALRAIAGGKTPSSLREETALP